MSRELVDSGVDWIGSIPSDWKTIRLKNSVVEIKGGVWGTEEKGDENDIPCIRITDFDREKHKLKVQNLIIRNLPLEKQREYLVEKGDLLIEKSGGGEKTPVGFVVLIDRDMGAIYTNFISKFKVNKSLFLPEYLNFLHSSLYNNKITLRSIKQTTGIQNLDIESYLNEIVPIPNIEIQKKIASFLNEKVSQIDSFIEKTKQSIEELIRYKHSLIIETATKGLNPNLEMKDSGIEWVGKIPKHWEVSYLNRYFREHKMKNIGLLETNLLSLSYGKIVQKDINTNDGLLPASFEGYNIIDRGDIVLRLTDLQNDKKSLRVGFATQRGIITSAYVTLRKVNEMFSEYMYYYLHSFDLCKGFYGLGSGVRQSLNFEGLKKLKIVKPPLSEQREIVELLNNKTNQIDDLIKKKEKLVNEMESYKKSFIYEYVTGKREVL